jgi:hypothetical protein
MDHNRENIEPGNQSYMVDEISLREQIEKQKVFLAIMAKLNLNKD